MLVQPVSLKFLCTKNGHEREIVNKKPRIVTALTLIPVADPLFDKGKFLELTGKSTLRIVSPELSAGDEIHIGHEYLVTIAELPSNLKPSGQEEIPAAKKKR